MEDNKDISKKILKPVIGAAIIVFAILVVGYFYDAPASDVGDAEDVKQIEMEIAEPAKEAHSIVGTITAAEPALLTISVPEERKVIVSEQVFIKAAGSEKDLPLSTLKVGDRIKVFTLRDPLEPNPYDPENKIQAKVIEIMQ